MIQDMALHPCLPFAHGKIFTAIILALLFILIRIWPSIRLHLRLRSFPRSGIDPGLFNLRAGAARQQFYQHGGKLVEEGYKKHKDTPFVVQTLNQMRLVIPPKYVDETRNLPDTELSHKIALLDRFLGPYTGMKVVRHTSAHRDVCKVQLTSNLGVLLPHMKEELDRYLSSLSITIGEGRTVKVGAFQTTLEAIAHISSRVIIDDISLCRSPTWLNAMVEYPGNAATVSMALRKQPTYLRPLIYPFIGVTKTMRVGMRAMKSIILPTIQQRRQQMSSPSSQNESKMPLDILQFLLDAQPNATAEQIIGNIFFLVIAAIHSSSFTATHAIYDLCAMPDVQVSLRKEVEDKLSVSGGEITLSMLRRLRKMDSFLKESHRVNSPGVLNYNRVVQKDIVISDGTTLPAGAMVCIAGAARSKDPMIYSSPYEFQPLRYYVPENEAKAKGGDSSSQGLFPSTALGDSWFGHGPQACPGRWYADAQIKLLLATLLLRYDLTFPGGQTKRPSDVKADEKVLPDPTQEIILCERMNPLKR